jgi:hypothetical protein
MLNGFCRIDAGVSDTTENECGKHHEAVVYVEAARDTYMGIPLFHVYYEGERVVTCDEAALRKHNVASIRYEEARRENVERR